MARITVEDCLEHVENRFILVTDASKRARRLALGSVESMLEWENDKATVVALREIAAGYSFKDEDENEATDTTREVKAEAELQGTQAEMAMAATELLFGSVDSVNSKDTVESSTYSTEIPFTDVDEVSSFKESFNSKGIFSSEQPLRSELGKKELNSTTDQSNATDAKDEAGEKRHGLLATSTPNMFLPPEEQFTSEPPEAKTDEDSESTD